MVNNMAIDLFCYTSYAESDLKGLVNRLVVENDNLFSDKFIISKVREINVIGREIALEYGLNARSLFLIGVNQKSASGEVPLVADLVRSMLGKDSVVILWENERMV